MAKIKMKKKSTSTDMTAMCDVAFLLLTFFILTATAKVPEALPVDTPASTVQTKLPETDLATITIGKGKVFYDFFRVCSESFFWRCSEAGGWRGQCSERRTLP